MSEAGSDLWNPGDKHQAKESPKRALTASVAVAKLEPECLFPLTTPHYCILLQYCSINTPFLFHRKFGGGCAFLTLAGSGTLLYNVCSFLFIAFQKDSSLLFLH